MLLHRLQQRSYQRTAFLQSTLQTGNIARQLSACSGLQVPEHTWGVDIKIYLDDYSDWTNAELQRQIAARDPRYMYTIDAWMRQRSYTRWALEALDASLVSSLLASSAPNNEAE